MTAAVLTPSRPVATRRSGPSLPKQVGLEIRKSLSTRSGRLMAAAAAVMPAAGVVIAIALNHKPPSAAEMLSVVVGWELSWYRFEIDLADEAAGVRRTGQGAELAELDEADRSPNAVVDEHGVLHGIAQPA